jgi:hypothetical protein
MHVFVNIFFQHKSIRMVFYISKLKTTSFTVAEGVLVPTTGQGLTEMKGS